MLNAVFAVVAFSVLGAAYARAEAPATLLAQVQPPGTLPREDPASGPAKPAAESEDPDFDQFEDTSTNPAKVFDPLRGYNRFMFKVNDKFYFWLAKPLARAYGWAVPKPVRVAFNRGFYNLRFPIRFASCLLQLKMRRSGEELRRFVVNSTLGLGGLFDPSERWFAWERPPEEDFGQALGRYGVGDGFPVVIPLLGQSNVRDGLALVPSYLVSPLYYVTDAQTSVSVAAGDQFNFISLHIGEYESVKKDALDPYALIRDAYKQNRDKKIQE